MGDAVKQIPLTQGKVTLVDDEDFIALSQYKWCFGSGYAKRMTKVNGVEKMVTMHRQILSAPAGAYVDHINGDKLDNRRANLRLTNSAGNSQNRDKQKGAFSSGYKGVTFFKRAGRWRAQIHVDNKNRHLGYFQYERDAALAYNAAARELFGEFARLNEVTL